jgi:hypothetical protein
MYETPMAELPDPVESIREEPNLSDESSDPEVDLDWEIKNMSNEDQERIGIRDLPRNL